MRGVWALLDRPFGLIAVLSVVSWGRDLSKEAHRLPDPAYWSSRAHHSISKKIADESFSGQLSSEFMNA